VIEVSGFSSRFRGIRNLTYNYLIGYIFSGAPPPDPIEAGDANCSGDVDIDDAVYLIGYIFSGGNSPCDPNGDEVPDC